jgi:hypothetical protein
LRIEKIFFDIQTIKVPVIVLVAERISCLMSMPLAILLEGAQHTNGQPTPGV